MKINNLEKFLAKARGGEMPLGVVVTFADPAVTELVCAAGFDFVWIDGEHGEMDRFSAMTHLMAVRGTECASLYRVPSCDHTEIKKIIDFAPAGVIVPMVMNADDARRAVAACRYPPTGNRGCGFRRGLAYGAGDFDTYWQASKEEPLVIIQLEHIEAVRNLDEILRVPGIGAILIGPYDLSASMGLEGRWDAPEVEAVFEESCRKVRESGVLLGVYTESQFDIWKRRGAQFMAIKNDTNALLLGLQEMKRRATR
ncbi:MAG: 2,4-dihydroxyhept-2-ene-1,7-dioic acid aldolase [Kiritimatiellae bacterium]|nr:2,4-dihydroxyhept-2-ene-1,7-dioic acid aldolase [Kiritimatiellia bacterium]